MVMGAWRRAVLGLVFVLAPGAAPAQPRTAQVAGPGQGGVPLVDLAARASAAVVQLQVTGFGPADEEKVPGVVVRQRSIGSGVVLDPEGWILTNAHMVEGARLIEVQPGDLIHALDDAPIATFEQLAEGLRRYREGDKGVLTVEREGGMRYLVFEAP